MQNNRNSPLGKLSAASFLKDYWQKKPLLIPQGFPGFKSPISADELAGLACEEHVESRMVFEQGEDGPWTVRHGPFAETVFSSLPESHWTLLVQGCNRLLPEVAELLEHFSFIPNWRVDDIMVSYATDHGSVGPHVDQYDVFLIQGQGKRRWQISDQQPSDADLIPGLPLRIMREFFPAQEWLVSPGDILYLPPGVPHYGVAQGECITLSVGFRAPSHRELLMGFLDYILEQTPSRYNEPRYTDMDLQLQTHSGAITPAALDKVTQILQQIGNDRAQVETWFGRYITRGQEEDSDDEQDALTITDVAQLLNENDIVYRNEHSRFAFIDKETDGCLLFVDGEATQFTESVTPAVHAICDTRTISTDELIDAIQDPSFAQFITRMINEDKLYFE